MRQFARRRQMLMVMDLLRHCHHFRRFEAVELFEDFSSSRGRIRLPIYDIGMPEGTRTSRSKAKAVLLLFGPSGQFAQSSDQMTTPPLPR